jgi:tripartite-type tricarboxylate transporter receptor subunit TctC
MAVVANQTRRMNMLNWQIRSAVVAATLLSSVSVVAQTYPSKPVRIVVPYAAGGPVDLYQRKFAEKFSAILKQPFVVENRGGANGLIGAEAVACWAARRCRTPRSSIATRRSTCCATSNRWA